MTKNQHENKVSVIDMMMVHWMCSKTRHDMIKNENIIERVGVTSIVGLDGLSM